ncbi:MAG: hypothetical protein U0796_00215 [Gemmatales bacterium]
MFARHGLELPRSTTCDWMASCRTAQAALRRDDQGSHGRAAAPRTTRWCRCGTATPGKTTSTSLTMSGR